MRRLILAAAVLAFSQLSWAEPPKAVESPPILDLRINPLMDLHFWVRKVASEKGELPAIEGLPAAVAAVRQVGDSLRGGWGILDGAFIEATTAEELARVAAELPETLTLRDGRTLSPRQSVASLAAAYKPLEKTFLATVWPRHREIAERAAAALRKELLPKAPEVYADIARHLDVSIPRAPIPIYLVAAAPSPGAFSMRSQGSPYSVVALEGEADSQWVEIVVHESIHGLDVLAGEGSVLAELRRRLAQVPGANPQEIHDFVHTLMFVQPASTVRRILNPAHKDYGDVDGYYAKVPRATAVVVPAWRDYLDGKITREAALERIVKGFAGKEKGGSPDGTRGLVTPTEGSPDGTSGLVIPTAGPPAGTSGLVTPTEASPAGTSELLTETDGSLAGTSGPFAFKVGSPAGTSDSFAFEVGPPAGTSDPFASKAGSPGGTSGPFASAGGSPGGTSLPQGSAGGSFGSRAVL